MHAHDGDGSGLVKDVPNLKTTTVSMTPKQRIQNVNTQHVQRKTYAKPALRSGLYFFLLW